MENVHLVLPCEEYLNSYYEACKLTKEYDSDNLEYLHNPEQFESWKNTIFSLYQDYKTGKILGPGNSQCTMFWLVEGTEFIGSGRVSNVLTNSLKIYGGQIDYLIKWNKRKMGYGGLMLKLLLKEAGKMGLKEVLVQCTDSNTSSQKVIEKNCGIYLETTSVAFGEYNLNLLHYSLTT